MKMHQGERTKHPSAVKGGFSTAGLNVPEVAVVSSTSVVDVNNNNCYNTLKVAAAVKSGSGNGLECEGMRRRTGPSEGEGPARAVNKDSIRNGGNNVIRNGNGVSCGNGTPRSVLTGNGVKKSTRGCDCVLSKNLNK